MSVKELTRAALLAALYAALTVALAPLSYGPYFQLRVAEALTVLPYVTPVAVPALFAGCLIANVFGGLGMYDIALGSLATLLAAVLTRRMPRPYLAPLPPVVINAIVVGAYLSFLTGASPLVTMGYVGLGEFLACYGLGYPLLLVVLKNEKLRQLVRGR